MLKLLIEGVIYRHNVVHICSALFTRFTYNIINLALNVGRRIHVAHYCYKENILSSMSNDFLSSDIVRVDAPLMGRILPQFELLDQSCECNQKMLTT